jgi:flagellar biosynthesis/type III secretory pathway protein FliH
MRAFLDRSTTIKQVKKEQIKARLDMFEQLFEESPTIQSAIQRLTEKRLAQERQESHQEGRQEGLLEGRQEGLLALQDLLVDSVEGRYPDLAELARQRTGQSDQLDALKRLILRVMTAPNADAVRRLLEAGTAL